MAEAREAWDEVGDALRSFGEAAKRLGDAVSGVVRDPDFQERGQRLATTLGSALPSAFAPPFLNRLNTERTAPGSTFSPFAESELNTSLIAPNCSLSV